MTTANSDNDDSASSVCYADLVAIWKQIAHEGCLCCGEFGDPNLGGKCTQCAALDHAADVVKELIHDSNCHKCGSLSGVYLQICDDCITQFNKLST